MHRIAFRVFGRPVPQGSMVASYNRKQGVSRVHHVQGAALAQWRAAIRQGAIDAGAEKIAGAVYVSMTFGMTRPQSHYATRHFQTTRRVKDAYLLAYPSGVPDVDKLARAVLDALDQVCYYNDSQVVALFAQKVYRGSTEVVVSEYGKVSERAADAGRVEENATEDIGAGQLGLSDLWDARS